MASPQAVTQLLIEWSDGDPAALDRLLPLVYAELRRIAARYMASQPPGHTLQTTALLNEAYLRLAHNSGTKWEHRAHFFGVAAKAMRHILVDHARSRSAARRCPQRAGRYEDAGSAVSLEHSANMSDARLAEVIALDDALSSLARLAPRQSQVVELRYFGGLTNEEISQALNVSPETIIRDWRAARAWLYLQLNGSSSKADVPGQ